MLKKMMLLALSAAALVAFAVPAMAQANVQLTDQVGEEKVPLKPGAEVTATSIDLVTTLGGAQLECGLVTIHYTVKTNGLEHVLLEEGIVTTDDCALNVGIPLPAEITNPEVGDLTLDTWGTGIVDAHFTSDVPALGLEDCDLGGPVHVEPGELHDEILVTGSPLTGSGEAGCSEAGEIHGSFTLETEDKTPVTLDYTPTS